MGARDGVLKQRQRVATVGIKCGAVSLRKPVFILWSEGANSEKRGTRSDMIIAICLGRKFSIKPKFNPKVQEELGMWMNKTSFEITIHIFYAVCW